MARDILFYAIALGKEGVSCSKPNDKQQITKLEFLGTWSH
jgi:hypothetical protein